MYMYVYMHVCMYVFVCKLCRSLSWVGHRPDIIVQDVHLLSKYDTIEHILHELFHVLGRYHEHMRDDRDNYVQIHPENIYAGEMLIIHTCSYRVDH